MRLILLETLVDDTGYLNQKMLLVALLKNFGKNVEEQNS